MPCQQYREACVTLLFMVILSALTAAAPGVPAPMMPDEQTVIRQLAGCLYENDFKSCHGGLVAVNCDTNLDQMQTCSSTGIQSQLEAVQIAIGLRFRFFIRRDSAAFIRADLWLLTWCACFGNDLPAKCFLQIKMPAHAAARSLV